MRKFAFLFFTVSVLSAVFGFNLESRIPVIKEGNAGSYFGYSVAEHQEIADDGTKRSTSW